MVNPLPADQITDIGNESLSSLVEIACDLFLAAKYSVNVIISQFIFSMYICVYIYICIYVSTAQKAK